MDPIVVVGAAAGLGASSWLGYRAWLFGSYLHARGKLRRSARAHGSIRIGRDWLAPSDWLTPKLTFERDGRTIAVVPRTLGFLRDVPPWTWWQITTDLELPRFVLVHVCRNARFPVLESQRKIESGDAAFEADHVAYTYDSHLEQMADAQALVADEEIRTLCRELIVEGSDHCSFGSRVWITRRRAGLSLDDVLQQVERTARLVRATARVLAPASYR